MGDIQGPHTDIPQPEQQRVMLEGRLLEGGLTTLIVIRDPVRASWVVYLEGLPDRAIRVSDEVMAAAGDRFRWWRQQLG
ncbi:MAG: hypothetical protein ACREQ5_00840 [Candidatus Dormibacteria bacterium]